MLTVLSLGKSLHNDAVGLAIFVALVLCMGVGLIVYQRRVKRAPRRSSRAASIPEPIVLFVMMIAILLAFRSYFGP